MRGLHCSVWLARLTGREEREEGKHGGAGGSGREGGHGKGGKRGSWAFTGRGVRLVKIDFRELQKLIAISMQMQ